MINNGNPLLKVVPFALLYADDLHSNVLYFTIHLNESKLVSLIRHLIETQQLLLQSLHSFHIFRFCF